MNRERITNDFIKMVNISSLSLREKNFATIIVMRLERLGFDVTVDDAGEAYGGDFGNIYGILRGDSSKKPVLFCAHLDTVSPGENIQPIIKENMVCTDGSTILGADDKCGIAAILEAVESIVENGSPHGDIEVLFTIGEEIGMLGSKHFDTSMIKSKMAFVMDSSGKVGEVIVKAPTQCTMNITINGKSAHAGVAPEKGISAIQVAAEAICNMKLLRIDSETTANIGTICGGKVTNIVCDKVVLKAESRSLKEDKLFTQVNHMEECIKQACLKYNANYTFDKTIEYPPFEISPDSEIIRLLQAAMDRIGLNIKLRPSGGGFDANILNGKGIQAVVLACGMFNAHTSEEYLILDDLYKAAELVREIILIS